MDGDDEFTVSETIVIRSGTIWQTIATTVATYPFDLVRTLIQIGYEPLPPYPTKTLFGVRRMGLPGAFSYMGFIINDEQRFSAIFRGLPYRLVERILLEHLNQYLYRRTSEYLSPSRPTHVDVGTSPAPQEAGNSVADSTLHRLQEILQTHFIPSYEEFLLDFCAKPACRLSALVISHPFYVLFVRSCAQFVGKETVYDSFVSGFKDIYLNEGLAGFYSGFGPRVRYEILCITIVGGAQMVIKRVFDKPSNDKIPKGFWVSPFVQFIVPALLYTYNLVTSVMAINNCKSLEAARIEPHFEDWRECWTYLSSMGSTKRGAALLFRYQAVPPRNQDIRILK